MRCYAMNSYNITLNLSSAGSVCIQNPELITIAYVDILPAKVVLGHQQV